ncbi:MAG TPA: molecular chaperone HscC [Allosphingosinicella sp.]|jgi:molecular chaperone HscC
MIVGIDLGTTNSAIGIWKDGEARLVPNSLGDLLTPSAVGLGDDGALLVGMAARDRQSTHPTLTATAFKRLMGTQQKVRLGRTEYSPEDLSALVLRSLKADAEASLGEPVESAIVTVPAYFNDRQRKATRRGGELAGLRVDRLINEPTAAALAHGIHDRGDRPPFLVFDLGGGTFDVSIVEIFEGIIEVRASAGDNRLGGEDFNDALVELVRPRLGAASLIDSRLRELLRAAAERTRRALTDRESAAFEVVWEGEAYSTEVGAAEFEAASAPLLARLRDPVLRSLRDSDMRIEELGEIVLVGGATRMPAVRRTVTRMFGRFPAGSINPDHAVALGAAVQAGLKARDAALEEIRLTDVCPFTLGVDCLEYDGRGGFRAGVFSPIIERNTVIPASRVRRYSTVSDFQPMVEFGIYQGESRQVAANVKLGSLRMDVPRQPAGHVAVDCRFSYDVSGILEIDVTVPGTDIAKQIMICDDDAAPSAEEVEARRKVLASLKVHPREQAANAAALSRAERCYESFIGDRREYIGRLVAGFEAVLEGQDPKSIEQSRRQLEMELNQLEGERFL